MRSGAVWGVALGAALVASPAWASEPSDGDASGAVATTMVAAVPIVPGLDRIDLTIRQPSAPDPFGTVKGAIRHRFASAMIDLYPARGAGFHVSVGTRFYTRRNFARDAMESTGGLLYSPRLPRGGIAIGRGFRRYTPAATMGYTVLADRPLLIGVEAGALFGRVVSPMPRGARLSGTSGERGDPHRQQLNPLLNLTVAYAF